MDQGWLSVYLNLPITMVTFPSTMQHQLVSPLPRAEYWGAGGNMNQPQTLPPFPG